MSPCILTGDTALTGLFIARQCGIAKTENVTLLLGEARKNAEDEKSAKVDVSQGQLQDIVWRQVDPKTGARGEEVDLLQLVAQNTHAAQGTTGVELQALGAQMSIARLQLAMDGTAFNILLTEGKLIRELLPKCVVFARMTPGDKVACVQLHMEKDTTAMCGLLLFVSFSCRTRLFCSSRGKENTNQHSSCLILVTFSLVSNVLCVASSLSCPCLVLLSDPLSSPFLLLSFVLVLSSWQVMVAMTVGPCALLMWAWL